MTVDSQTSQKPGSRLFGVGRLLVLALVLFRIIFVVWSLPASYQKLLNLEPNNGLPDWTQTEMQQIARSLDLSPQLLAGFLFTASLICLLSFWVVAGVLLWKKGDSVVGLLSFFILTGIGVGLSFLRPDTSQLTGWIIRLYEIQGSLVWTIFFLLLYLFPDGRFAPRWAGFLAPLPFVLFLTDSLYAGQSPGWLEIVLLGYVAGGAASQVYRYKRVSSPEGRQQTKWIVFALGLFIIFILATQTIPLLWSPLSQKTSARFLFDIAVNYSLGVLLSALLPISIAFSIFRYRLYDIDVIIRKTLVYTVVTIVLSLVYFGGVLLLQAAFAGLGAGQSPAAIVLSTLAIAALFNPLRRRVQKTLDRRFYRKKYNAEQVLSAFDVQVRDEVDVERISAALVSAIEETVQPEGVSLWIVNEYENHLQPIRPSWTFEMDIAPEDPFLARLMKESGVIDMDALKLDSAALRRLKAAEVKISAPLISQGELIGALNLGARRSEQGYSGDDRRLIAKMAAQAAPALRLAQLARQQQMEAIRTERMEQELRVAGIVQQTLLPENLPSLPGWELAAHWQPAREMSGDFYDFLSLPNGRLGLIIGDVTGKGVPAALVMATTRTIIRNVAERIATPGEALERVNNLLQPDIPANMFATCLYMILDPVTGCLQFANAGHNLPVLQINQGVIEPRATGMPLGLMPGMTYDEVEVQLTPGNRLLIYSDGLVEAHNPQGEMFSIPRLRELMAVEMGPLSGGSSGAALIELLRASLADFTGPGWEQEDDVTLVTLDYVGSG